jgi:hypothetical protein
VDPAYWDQMVSAMDVVGADGAILVSPSAALARPSTVGEKGLCGATRGIPVGAWLAGTSPAMTQNTDFKGDRHARPGAGHPRDTDGTVAFTVLASFSAPCWASAIDEFIPTRRSGVRWVDTISNPADPSGTV